MKHIKQQLQNIHEGLTDFQEATVKAIMTKYENGSERRILIADEVGLGKTIVAKGVIAKLLGNSLAQQTGILRVTYICSNLALAQENSAKLAVFNGNLAEKYVQDPSFSRLAELGVISLESDDEKILEVCSLTPGTSFNLTRGHGNKRERYIIYRALADQSELNNLDQNLSDFFCCEVSTWDDERSWFERHKLNPYVLDDFSSRLREPVSLSEQKCAILNLKSPNWITLLSTWLTFMVKECNDSEISTLASPLRSHLRVLFVQCCARNLSADLFILDEFQRFKELLDTGEETEQGLIAKEIFKKQDSTKVLLLSATPFKAISRLAEDETQDAHLDELRKLLLFLANGDPAKLENYEQSREELLSQILRLMDPATLIKQLNNEPKENVELILRPLICRTERVQISEDFDSVMKTRHEGCSETFSRAEVEAFIALDQLGQKLKELTAGRYGGQLLEFHKTAPWAVSFLSGYQFSKQLDKHIKNKALRKSLNRSKPAWLPYKKVERYHLNIDQDAPNAKIRLLSKIVFGDNGEKMLWVPPSMPYYPSQSPFQGAEGFSKTLLFSAFIVAPRALSALLSYQAEKRLVHKGKGRRPEYFAKSKGSNKTKQKVGKIIRFDGGASLVSWALIYPCQTLIDIPITPGDIPFEKLLVDRKEILNNRLTSLLGYVGENERKSDSWYALAPFLLDIECGNREKINTWIDSQLHVLNANKKLAGRHKHLLRLNKLLNNEDLKLGPMPDDLLDFLAMLSLAGAGVCLSRSWLKLWPISSECTHEEISASATQGAIALVHMFNKPEAQRVLKNIFKQEKKHWRSLLKYCAAGNIQAMLDEYGHILKDAGHNSSSAAVKLEGALGINTSTVTAILDKGKKGISLKEIRLRCHYAVPLGNQKMTDDKGINRIGIIRDAFNSPFRPFVLSSTSIGQEGLDFHWYCSRVVHWNLPQNPIDLEQREGRINRYKSLTVRRRVAERYRHAHSDVTKDIWEQLFSVADIDTKPNRKSDLVPFWHMPEGKAELERVVLMFPLSHETERLNEILKILSLYRLAFGQPRQQELLENLLHRKMSADEMTDVKRKLVIDLAPINYVK